MYHGRSSYPSLEKKNWYRVYIEINLSSQWIQMFWLISHYTEHITGLDILWNYLFYIELENNVTWAFYECYIRLGQKNLVPPTMWYTERNHRLVLVPLSGRFSHTWLGLLVMLVITSPGPGNLGPVWPTTAPQTPNTTLFLLFLSARSQRSNLKQIV